MPTMQSVKPSLGPFDIWEAVDPLGTGPKSAAEEETPRLTPGRCRTAASQRLALTTEGLGRLQERR